MASDTDSIRIVQNTQDQLKINSFQDSTPKVISNFIQPVFVTNDEIANKVQVYSIRSANGIVFTTSTDPKKRFYIKSIQMSFTKVSAGITILVLPHVYTYRDSSQTEVVFLFCGDKFNTDATQIQMGGTITFTSPVPLEPNVPVIYEDGIGGWDDTFCIITGYYADVQ